MPLYDEIYLEKYDQFDADLYDATSDDGTYINGVPEYIVLLPAYGVKVKAFDPDKTHTDELSKYILDRAKQLAKAY